MASLADCQEWCIRVRVRVMTSWLPFPLSRKETTPGWGIPDSTDTHINNHHWSWEPALKCQVYQVLSVWESCSLSGWASQPRSYCHGRNPWRLIPIYTSKVRRAVPVHERNRFLTHTFLEMKHTRTSHGFSSKGRQTLLLRSIWLATMGI